MGKTYAMEDGRLNREAVWQKVYRHFIVEGHRPPSMPRYHDASTGACCAIGLFDQDKALKEWNAVPLPSVRANASGIFEDIFGLPRGMADEDWRFLCEIQHAHDGSCLDRGVIDALGQFKLRLKERLDFIASHYGLAV